MTFCRYGRATWSSLAASLAIHGVALGGLVLSAHHPSPHLVRGEGSSGAMASRGVVMVRLLEASDLPGPPAARAPVSLPKTPATPIQPPAKGEADPPGQVEPLRESAGPAPAKAPRRRLLSKAQHLPAIPIQPEAPAHAAASDTQALTGFGVAAGSPPPLPPVAASAGTSTPAGGQLARVDLEAGGGSGGLDRVARPAVSIRPHYPTRARQRGEEADVAVEVWVGPWGEVDQVEVSKSAGAEFDAAAVAAVRKARFHPALRGGQRVPSRVALRLHFRLER